MQVAKGHATTDSASDHAVGPTPEMQTLGGLDEGFCGP